MPQIAESQTKPEVVRLALEAARDLADELFADSPLYQAAFVCAFGALVPKTIILPDPVPQRVAFPRVDIPRG